ncbi:WNT1-inducible-signaling pathway protein 2-like, partial [Homarus americanus]
TDGRTDGRVNREDSQHYLQESGKFSAHCVYPCGCGTVPVCRPGVPTVRDGCGCCWQCAGQAGELCDGATICDVSKNLTCIYDTTQDLTGTCQEVQPAKCTVNNRTYDDGENFTLDCRTQCTCQNGTYACVSLCPSENIPPSAQCHHPHLVTVPGQCCREWMCDTAPGQCHSTRSVLGCARSVSRGVTDNLQRGQFKEESQSEP